MATIEAEISGLSATEKAKRIDILWESLSPSEMRNREAAWAAESEDRIQAYETGKLQSRDASEVFAESRKNLRK